MRVLQVSHSPFGGVGILVTNLTRELADLGVTVGWFQQGNYDLFFHPYVRKHCDENRVKIFDFRNSPNLHISRALTHPRDEVTQPLIESRFRQVLDQFRPHIVHFHDLGGLCSSLISISAEHQIITVVSHHSYWFICPKQDLFFSDTLDICSGPGQGDTCSQCLQYSAIRVRSKRIWLAISQSLIYKLIPFVLRQRAKRLFLRLRHRHHATLSFHGTQIDESMRQFYAMREKENLRISIQHTTVNIAVSSFVKRRLIDWGVPDEAIKVQHIGTRAAEFLKPVDGPVTAPITFGFIGPWHYAKGLHILVDAYNRLRDSKHSTRLIVYGDPGPGSQYGTQVKRMNHKSSAEFRGRYRYENLQEVLSEIDVLVVPPLWYDNAPQVVFEGLSAGIPVIGARIGGIPDFVQDGKNGLLFESGNVDELVEKMSILANNPGLIVKLRDGIKPMKTMRKHALETISLYRSLIDG